VVERGDGGVVAGAAAVAAAWGRGRLSALVVEQEVGEVGDRGGRRREGLKRKVVMVTRG